MPQLHFDYNTRDHMTQRLESGRIYFEVSSHRQVSFEQLHIELSTLGFLEGRFDVIRTKVIAGVPRRARQLFGEGIGLQVLPPPDGELPTYLMFASLVSLSQY